MSVRSPLRITYLDGLRAIAILLVILFHAFGRWPAVMPYGANFEHFYLVRYGWLGVELFFLISGFVILMTLEKCSGFKDFMLRRWLRLFPTMLVCSLLIFVTAPLFSARPAGPAHFVDLLPGLFFTDLGWGLFGAGITPIEGSFWSLFVEVKFYVCLAWHILPLAGASLSSS